MTSNEPRELVALVCGPTGLVGQAICQELDDCADYKTVLLATRRPLDYQDTSKFESVTIDYSDLLRFKDEIKADHIFCALGTTIKKAGSKDEFRRVDFRYTLNMAHLSLDNGATHFSLVSALGANPNSLVFYSRVKGELEQALMELKLPSLAIFRPSLLLGNREEFRLREEIGKWMQILAPTKYKGVQAKDLARHMVQTALAPLRGTKIIESSEIPRTSP